MKGAAEQFLSQGGLCPLCGKSLLHNGKLAKERNDKTVVHVICLLKNARYDYFLEDSP